MKVNDLKIIAALRKLRLQKSNSQKKHPFFCHNITQQQIRELQQLGFVISEIGTHQYKIVKESGILFPENIISWRKSAHDNIPVFVFENTNSTMDAALRQLNQIRADNSDFHGAIWVANSQTSGRGRMMRYWHSPPGLGCWFTVSISSRHLETPATPSFAAAIAVHDAILDIGNISTTLKWPNDIVHNGKKLCGILVERSSCGRFFLVGIGLNVFQKPSDFPPEIRQKSTSLSQLSCVPPAALNRSRLIAQITDRLLEIATLGWQKILSDWCSKCLYFQEFVRLEKCGQIYQGIFHDIDSTGGIVLRDDTGKLTSHHSGDLLPARSQSNVAS